MKFGIAIIALAAICLAIFGIGYLAHAAWDRLRSRPPKPGCRHEVTSDIRWTEEGWVSVCLLCRAWIYHGDGQHPTK